MRLLKYLPKKWGASLKHWHYARRESFPYYGTEVHFPKDSLIFYRACREGVYERAMVNLISRLIEPGTHYFDVGGNIGLMSVPILHNCPSARVLTFEPSPNSAPFLRKTCSGSKHSDRWEIVPRAAGEAKGEIEFHLAGECDGAFDSFRDTGRVNIERVVRVPVTTLDAEWHRLGRPRVSAVKVDVEGAELQVLAGARQLLRECRPAVIVEWTPLNLRSFGIEPDALMTFAEKNNYGLYSTSPILMINGRTMLRLQLKTNDMFLLMPRDVPMAEQGANDSEWEQPSSKVVDL